MTKELFIESIEQLQKQYEHDLKCSEAFRVILPHDYLSGYDNSKLQEQLVKILQVEMNDEGDHSWIEYYIWELDFGKDFKDGCVMIDKQPFELKTPSDLWELLLMNKN